MSNEHVSHLNDLIITENISNNVSYSRIVLQLQYKDYRRNLTIERHATFMFTDTISDVIQKFLRIANLNDVLLENVVLVEFTFDNQHMIPPSSYKHMTLNELKIKQNSILYFEPSATVAIARFSRLTIFGPDRIVKRECEWNKETTTLKMLFDFVITTFSLQSIKHEQIRLITIYDNELDIISNSDKLLFDLGVNDDTWIFVQVVESQLGTSIVYVDCAYTNGRKIFDVPSTISIEKLKNRIEKHFNDYRLLEFNLFNRMHEKIDQNMPNQMLCELDIKPGQTIYAALRFTFSDTSPSVLNNNTSNTTTTRTSSLIKKPQTDEVIVAYQSPNHESVKIGANIHDTVGELIENLKAHPQCQTVGQYHISCGSICISNEQPNRYLCTYGIKPGNVINVRGVEKTPVQQSNDNNRFTSLYTVNELSRSSIYDTRPIGLDNLTNTCYMNSALQCLAHTIPLTQFFLNGLIQNISDDNRSTDLEWNQFYEVGTVTGAYADVLRNLLLRNKSNTFNFSFRPIHMKETIGMRAPRFATSDQQDAQEFMNFLLDEIHKEMKEVNGNESNNIIEELFFGKIQSTITCLECKHEVQAINPFSILSLPLVQSGRQFTIKFIELNGGNDRAIVNVHEDGQVKSLIQAFADVRPSYRFFRTIIVMTDDGQIDLEKPLNQLSTTEVVLVEQDEWSGTGQVNRFTKKPKPLTLEGCLREFCSIENLEDTCLCEHETCKKHTKASKQLQFSTLPPIIIIQLKRFSHKDGLRDKIQTFVDYPIEGLDLSSFLLSREEAIYDLFAVTKHTGSIYSGHYIAVAKHEANGSSLWYKFEDSYVSSFCYTNDIVSDDAYLLFYMRKDKSKQ
ncbi:unnamed protein product [Adineta steineri]|uniref:ubiquitinyl hydrolase 1 n=1 Tax=Adineta steineri TaxID=433720 RepID=A0A818JG60_9BILA|nr:unnamed protein product [Adineta steineri]CAF3537969.1 unnamed protein product [Adineta steineri]